MFWTKIRRADKKKNDHLQNLIPSLREIVERDGLDLSTLNLALVFPEGWQGPPFIEDRHRICLVDKSHQFSAWNMSSLRELFRGEQEPPSYEIELDENYVEIFFRIERNVLLAHDFMQGITTDEEMLRLYSLIRRRPDAKSEGFLHDVIYQSAALVLALKPLSLKEFESVMNRLTLSARHWKDGPASRHYIHHLRGSYLRLLEKGDPGMERLVHRARKWKDTVIIDRPPQIRKMSEVILDFAEPLLKKMEGEEDPEVCDRMQRNIIMFAIMVWNVSLVIDEKAKLKEKIIRVMREKGLQSDLAEAADLWLDQMLERKKRYFPDEKRMIADYEFSGSSDALRLNVLSVIAPEEAERWGVHK
ncbi:MAG: hypothetical protein HY587_07495 [Candidatus Omnitrophica bacterium]|nr:hypothetical protein [Candidatus Omnitrophota bacterium]